MPTLFGIKRGMTQIFTEAGNRLPVTVLEVAPNTVTAVKTVERDGYEAVQLGYGTVRPKVLAKPQRVAFEKSGVEPRRWLREVRQTVAGLEVGQQLGVDLFEAGQLVDVVGTSKGKGFAGTIKLHGFARGPTSHGSQNVRRPGSIGMHTHPGRTIRGKRMARRMGNERVTVRGLLVVAVDAERGHMLVKGPVPGNTGSLVRVSTSIKASKGAAS